MQFRLTYEGPLFSSRTDKRDDLRSRADHKQDIRKVFHKQLKQLWTETPHLGRVAEDGHWKPLPDAFFSNPRPKNWSWSKELAERYSCGQYHLVPLVNGIFTLGCGLDILLLRPGRAGQVLASGDIDNRVKTLIDALRIPGPDVKELGSHTPQDGEDPFYCLLENDSMVDRLSVEADTLLQPIGTKRDANDARVVVTVTVRPAEVMFLNLAFA